MQRPDVCRKLERELNSCRARYEVSKNDSYLSTVYGSEAETLQALLEQAESREKGESLLAELRKRLPEVEKEMDREAEHPTFDWYDEHHVYKVLEGRRDAYRKMIEILEKECDRKDR